MNQRRVIMTSCSPGSIARMPSRLSEFSARTLNCGWLGPQSLGWPHARRDMWFGLLAAAMRQRSDDAAVSATHDFCRSAETNVRARSCWLTPMRGHARHGPGAFFRVAFVCLLWVVLVRWFALLVSCLLVCLAYH